MGLMNSSLQEQKTAVVEKLRKLSQGSLTVYGENQGAFKGTVCVISSNPTSCNDGNARFKTVPMKALSEKVTNRISCF